jgi:hypothetical protein
MADRKRAHFQYLMSVHVNGNFSAKFFCEVFLEESEMVDTRGK